MLVRILCFLKQGNAEPYDARYTNKQTSARALASKPIKQNK